MSEITLPPPPEWFKRDNQSLEATRPKPKTEPNAETLTASEIHDWSPEDMRKYMKVPALREKIESIAAEITQEAFAQQRKDELRRQADLLGEEYVDEDVVAQQAEVEAQRVAAEAAEQQRVAAEAAETARKIAEAEAARLAAEAAKPKKIVVEYQVKDENGNPIGRPTHLEAATEEEMRQKLIKAHEEATRGFHRLKKQIGNVKETYAKKVETPVSPVLSDAEIMQALKDLKSDDVNVQLAAHQKLTKNEVDKQLETVRAEQRQRDISAAAAQASQTFLARHKHDYAPVDSNNKMIGQYIKDNDLDWTLDNLEVAFAALEFQLAPVEQPVATVRETNTPTQSATTTPTATQQPVASSTPAVTPASALPANTATETTAVVANPATQRRPGVNGGIEPGSSSVVRSNTQGTTDIGLTFAEINSWNAQTMRRNMANPAMRKKIEAVMLRENSPEKVAARQKRLEDQLRLAGQAR